MKGRVSAVWLYSRGSMKQVESALALPDFGFAECGHGRPGKKRNLVLIDEETLGELGLEPGRVKENVTTRGIAIQALPAGTRLRIGGAVVELTGPCEPCAFTDSIRPGLREASMGKRGALARVVERGEVRAGDAIEAVDSSLARTKRPAER